MLTVLTVLTVLTALTVFTALTALTVLTVLTVLTALTARAARHFSTQIALDHPSRNVPLSRVQSRRCVSCDRTAGLRTDHNPLPNMDHPDIWAGLALHN